MAPPKFRKDTRSKGPGGPKGSRPPRGEFKGGPKGGPKGDRAKGDFHKAARTKGDFHEAPKRDRAHGDFKGGSKAPHSKSDFHGSPKGGRTKGDFHGAPKRERTRHDFKGAPKGGDHATKGSSKGFKGNRTPYRDVPQKHDGPRPDTRPRAPRPERGDRPARQENWLYGLHAVQAALANPRRKLGRLVLSPRAAQIIDPELLDGMRVETMEPGNIDRLLPPGAVHQGVALETPPLPQVDFEALLALPGDGRRRVVLVLDQLSDPHNVGAILRSALAFGVTAVVVQDRHAPPQSGALAKAASGALDIIPYVEVVNIARALEKLSEHGFWRIALAGDGAKSLAASLPKGDVALVLGSEGDGIRRLVRENCDVAASIPIEGAMESLNVSNAAAIALYELRRS